MRKLRIRLSNIEGDNGRFNIALNDNNPITSLLPFETDRRFLSAVLTCLHPVELRKIEGYDGQDYLFQWMIEQDFIVQNQAGEFSYASGRYEAIGNRIYQCLFDNSTIVNHIANTIEKRLNNEDDEILNIQIEYSPNSLNSSRIPLYPWQLSYYEKHNDFLFHQKIVFSFHVIFDNNNTKCRKFLVDQIKVLVIAPNATDAEHGLHSIESTIPSLNESLKDKGLRDEIKVINLYGDQKICSFKYMKEQIKAYKKIYKTQGFKPNIIHFDGHGVHRRWCNNPECSKYENPSFIDRVRECSSCQRTLAEPEGFLLFHDSNGKPNYISARKFVESIHDLKPQLVVIAACRSALVTEGRTVFGGIVQKLIHKNIPFVIGFQFNVTDKSLKNFTEVFYDELLNNEKPLLESFYEAAKAMEYNEWYKSVIFSTKDIPNEKIFEYINNNSSSYSQKPRADPPTPNFPPKPPEDGSYQRNPSPLESEKRRLAKLPANIIKNYTNSKVLVEIVVCIYDSFMDTGVPTNAYKIYEKAFGKIGTHYEKMESLDLIPSVSSEFKDFYRTLFSLEISNDGRFTRYRQAYCKLGEWIETETINILKKEGEIIFLECFYSRMDFVSMFTDTLKNAKIIAEFWQTIYDQILHLYVQ